MTRGGVTSHCLRWFMFMELLSFSGDLRDVKIQLLTKYDLWRCYISLSWMVNVYGVVITLRWPKGRMTYGGVTSHCLGWLMFMELLSFSGDLRDVKIQLLTKYDLQRCYISPSWMVNVYGAVIILMWPSVVGRMLKSNFSLKNNLRNCYT